MRGEGRFDRNMMIYTQINTIISILLLTSTCCWVLLSVVLPCVAELGLSVVLRPVFSSPFPELIVVRSIIYISINLYSFY